MYNLPHFPSPSSCCSPLLRLNQSLGGGTSLLNSAHTAQLQESLRETKRGLEQTLNAQQASERSRKHLAAKLEDYQRRHDEVVGVKLSLENNKLDLELEVCNIVCCCVVALFTLVHLRGKGRQKSARNSIALLLRMRRK